MKRLKKITIPLNADMWITFVDALGTPTVATDKIVVHTSDPEIAMMQGDRLVPTGRKLGKVKVFMIDPATLTVLETRLLEIVKPSKAGPKLK